MTFNKKNLDLVCFY